VARPSVRHVRVIRCRARVGHRRLQARCQAGQQATQRMYARTEDRDTATTWATREAQYDAVCTWGIPDHALLQRLSCLRMPVFVANGDSDPMILPHYSYLLAGLIPQGPREDLPRLGARVPVPAPCGIRR